MSQQQPVAGRGRARATARGRPPPQAQGRGLEGRRPGQPAGGPANGGPSSKPPQQIPAAAGRGRSNVRDDASLLAGVANLSIASSENGDSSHETTAQPLGRGAMRGRRQIGDGADTIPAELLPTRPDLLVTKKGKAGTPIKVCANYFRMKTVTNWCLYHYDVSFCPEQDRISVKKKLIRETMRQHGAYLFDGNSLFSSHKIRTPLEFVAKDHNESDVKVTVQRVNDLQPSDYHYLQVFGVLIRNCLAHLNLTLIGRNFFDREARIPIPEFNLYLFPGYITSIRQHENDILMCAEITTKVMRNDTAWDLIRSCANRGGNFRDTFSKAIIGQSVMTVYNDKHYRITDVDYDTNPTTAFSIRNGTMTFMDYYLSKYEIRISDARQPLLVAKSRARDVRAGQDPFIRLVPELCIMTGMSDEMTSNFKLMQALAQHTRVNPGARVNRLNELNRRLHSNPAIVEDFQRWNMTLDKRLVTFDARRLDPVDIIAGNSVTYSSGPDVDWTKDLRSKPMYACGHLTQWAVIYQNRNELKTKEFVSLVIKAGGGMRFTIEEPKYKALRGDRTSEYLEELDNVLSDGAYQLIMTVFPNDRPERYNAVKKRLYVDRGIPSQVILDRTTRSKGVFSIATKVAVQLNCKLGGAPWTASVPKGTMVVGFDVCHDPLSKAKSFGAMVASLNSNFTRYFSAVSAEQEGNELSSDFALHLAQGLRSYTEGNKGSLPESIFIYRDGVGEGQIPYVKNTELKSIKDRLKQVYGGTLPKLVFIIVTKRINTRIFQIGNRDNYDNPRPGTVVDDTITFPHKYDFFLVSQTVRQGTVSPTSYNVIYDDGSFTPDYVQKLTYRLTHLYYNWSGTIRVPAPCQYAHKLAYMAGQTLGKVPSSRMNTYLYFL